MTQIPTTLRDAFVALSDVLAGLGVRYAFIGAVPVIVWGRVRTTTDLDLVMAVEEATWPRVTSALLAAEFSVARPLVPGTADEVLPDIARFWFRDTVAIDLFIAKTEFEAAVLSTATEAEVVGTRVRVATPEASIVYKLLAARPHDGADVEAIFTARAAAKTAIDWAFLERWVREWEIEERLEPYRERFDPRR